MSYRTDRLWADPYTAPAAALVREHLGDIVDVVEADEDRDLHAACDLVLSSDVTVSLRVRRPPACSWARSAKIGDRQLCPRQCRAPWQCDPRDATIRESRPLGVLTELDKMRAGRVRWLFYAWVKRLRI